jgi:sulfite exporter TauE/SafE
MTALTIAIFTASILGSFHCAGMCGAFLAVATGDLGGGGAGRPFLQTAYHAGRLVSYLCLGAAAGAAGGMINIAGGLAGIRPLAATLAGAVMILFGLRSLLRADGFHLRINLPARWTRVVQNGHRFAFKRAPVSRALTIGLLTTLLPCGWLYSFAITAAGTGSAFKGMLAMTAFWLGTLPALVLVGAGVKRILGPLGKRLPAVTCLVLVVAGLYTLLGRTLIDPVALAARISPTSVNSVNVPTPGDAPCCEKHDPGR